jgi:uncharacterized membrane protein
MRSVFNFVFVFFMVVIIITAGSCRYDKSEFIPCSSVSAEAHFDTTHGARVKSIIATNCASSPDCHTTGGLSGVEFTSYTQIRANVTRIRLRAVVERTMPAGSTLSPQDIATLRCWIDNGAKPD